MQKCSQIHIKELSTNANVINNIISNNESRIIRNNERGHTVGKKRVLRQKQAREREDSPPSGLGVHQGIKETPGRGEPVPQPGWLQAESLCAGEPPAVL